MASFAEFIAESYFSEAEVTWQLVSLTHAVASFEAKSVLVEVDFEQTEVSGPWNVSFNTMKGEKSDLTMLAFRIFNGVFQAVREFIETRKPELLVFASKDADLSDIYRTYLRREQKSFEDLGYRLEEPQRVAPYMEFALKRTKPSEWRG